MKQVHFNQQKEASEILDAMPTPIETLNQIAVDKLKSGIAHFAFIKKDGTFREAFGTLEPNMLAARIKPEAYEPAMKRNSETNQVYFDLGANDWRQYTISNLVMLF